MTAGAPVETDAFLDDLDRELSHLARRLEPTAPSVVIEAVGYISRAMGQGHVALDLSVPPQELVGLLWPAATAAAGPESAVVLDRLASWHREMGHWLGERPSQARHLLTLADAPASAVSLLVWDAPRLYLRRAFDTEQAVARHLVERIRAAASVPFDADRLETLLPLWLPQGGDTPVEDQRRACRRAVSSPLTVITGGPGSGKTHTAARVLALLQACRPAGTPALRIGLAAPTGKAAGRLRQALEQAWSGLPRADLPESFWLSAQAAIRPATTLHALLGGALHADDLMRPVTAHPLPLDVLLVDEASMLDLDLTHALLRSLPSTARLILIGDRRQLASVEAGSVLADIVDGLDGGRSPEVGEPPDEPTQSTLRAQPDAPVVALTHGRRFEGPIADWAQAVLSGDAARIQALCRRSDVPTGRWSLQQLADWVMGPQGGGPLWDRLRDLLDRPWSESEVEPLLSAFQGFRLLCAVRHGPWGAQRCNRAIEQALSTRGWIDACDTWYHGRPVMVTRNDRHLGLHNGDVGLVLAAPHRGGPRLCWWDAGEIRSVACSRLAHVETAYAMTVHKSQGSEFDRVALVLPPQDAPVLTRELLYTGLTRARRALWLVADEPELQRAASRVTRRMGGLASRLCHSGTGAGQGGADL